MINRKHLATFCDEWLSAWTGNRPETLIGFYADDVFYLDPGRPGGIDGRNALFLYFKKLLARYPNWTWNREELFVTEGGFVLKWSARLGNAEEEIQPFFGMDIVDVEHDLITRNEVYFDTAAMMS